MRHQLFRTILFAGLFIAMGLGLAQCSPDRMGMSSAGLSVVVSGQEEGALDAVGADAEADGQTDLLSINEGAMDPQAQQMGLTAVEGEDAGVSETQDETGDGEVADDADDADDAADADDEEGESAVEPPDRAEREARRAAREAAEETENPDEGRTMSDDIQQGVMDRMREMVGERVHSATEDGLDPTLPGEGVGVVTIEFTVVDDAGEKIVGADSQEWLALESVVKDFMREKEIEKGTVDTLVVMPVVRTGSGDDEKVLKLSGAAVVIRKQ